MPTKPEVRQAVVWYLAGATGMSPDSIQDSWELKGAPLRFDDHGLGYLAMSLRGYVKAHKPSATVTVTELRKAGLKVTGLTDLIHGRVQ